jgi:hypothetical protein
MSVRKKLNKLLRGKIENKNGIELRKLFKWRFHANFLPSEDD